VTYDAVSPSVMRTWLWLPSTAASFGPPYADDTLNRSSPPKCGFVHVDLGPILGAALAGASARPYSGDIEDRALG